MAVEETSKLDVRLDEADCAAQSGFRGVDFIREFAEEFDLSRLAYLKIAPGAGGGGRVYGVCRFPAEVR